jgi:hypothetical protein
MPDEAMSASLLVDQQEGWIGEKRLGAPLPSKPAQRQSTNQEVCLGAPPEVCSPP